jgi:myosin heavy subunit
MPGLSMALTQKFEAVGRGSTITQFFKVEKAVETCHAFAKAIYGNMFDWLVMKVNETLFHGTTKVHFGCLDIFGFETFKINSFEQLCINFTNEKLQFHFNAVIFEEEMKLYEEEGVPSDKITFKDNKPCVELVEKKKDPPGILALLDEECALPRGTDVGFLNKCDNKFGKQKGKPPHCEYFEKKPQDREAFSVQHFAGPVKYTVTNFLEKNRDAISKTLHDAAAASSQRLMAEHLFKADQGGEGGGKKSGKKTLGWKFKESLDSLMVALYATEPAFIRCVKSNHAKKPGIFTGGLALSQLRNGGLFEAIKIRRAGYGYRIPLNTFMRQYAVIYADLSAASRKKGADERAICEGIIGRFTKDHAGADMHTENFVMGKTKVFLKTICEQNMLEKRRKEVLGKRVVKVQAVVRGFRYRIFKWREEHAAEEEARLAMERAILQARMREERAKFELEASVCIQSIARMRYAAKQVRTLNDTRALQRAELEAEASRDVTVLRNLIDTLKAKAQTDPVASSMLMVRVKRSEQRLSELLDVQELLYTIQEAMENVDLDELAECLKRAATLRVTNLPEVRDAKSHWGAIQNKRDVMDRLTNFLRDESVDEDVPRLVEEARRLGIKGDFLDHINTVYDEVKDRLEARNTLRRGVEFVDPSRLRVGIEHMREVLKVEPSYATKELRAGEQLLRMVRIASL